MGVTFFADDAPVEFGKFDRALITMFRLTSGETWVSLGQPGWGEDGGGRGFGLAPPPIAPLDQRLNQPPFSHLFFRPV